MSNLAITLFVIVTLPAGLFAQDPINTKKHQVEEGLQPQGMIMNGSPAPLQSLKDRMKARKVNGVSIAVIDDGRITWADGYGIRDAGVPGDLVDTTTLFQCASIGKTITALAALHLVKEGRISLDEPVNEKLSGWRIAENNKTTDKKVTLRTLLSHSSGFDDDYGFEGYYPHTTLPTLVQMLQSQPPANTHKSLVVRSVPGTVERYSGGGFLIIQQLIEDLTGVPFDRYVDSIVFKPLQMKHTTFTHYPDETLGWPIARGHDGKGKPDKKRKYMVYPEMAAAGPWTTPSDLARFVLELQQEYHGLSNLIADSSLVRQMLSPQINTTGLGVHLKGSGEVAAFWHSGNTAGYTGFLFGTLDGKGAVVLTNSDAGEWLGIEVIRSVADIYAWPAMQTRHLKATTDNTYAKFSGTYSKGKTRVVIGKNGDGLFLDIGNDKKVFTLYEESDNSFLIKEKPDHLRLTFDSTPDGVVSAINVFQDCGTVVVSLPKVQ